MWQRSKMVTDGITHVKITATFAWDSGDPNAGIAAGWGEDTCVEIKAGPFRTWITWRDYTFTMFRNRGRYRKCEEIKVDSGDPATWIIDTVETEYIFTSATGEREGRTGLAEYALQQDKPDQLLTLSTLPAVLDVVREAYADYGAAERLSVAQEGVDLAESYLDELRDRTEATEVVVREAKNVLDIARADFHKARTNAQARGLA